VIAIRRTIVILGIMDRVHIMVDISDDPKIVRRHAEVTGVVRPPAIRAEAKAWLADCGEY
jgi:hypothetical protein